MLEKFVELKIKLERARVDKVDDITPSDIKKSKLSTPLKRYILARFEGKLTDYEFTTLLTKAVKLNINYTIRPKWTLLNFLFNKYDSQQAEVVKEKADVFSFYRFYVDFIINYIDEHSLAVITKDKVSRFINEANKALHEKLIDNITGVKIKNFFIQIYRLSEKNQDDVNLTSTAPYLFIKTFLEDKDYNDILEKFDVIDSFESETEISLKDCIKIVSGKYSAIQLTEEQIEQNDVEVKDIAPGLVQENSEDEKAIENDREKEYATKEENDASSREKEKDIIVVDFKKWEDEVEKDLEKKIDISEGNEVQDKEEKETEEKTEERKLPTEVIEESNLEIEKRSISRLFKQSELVNICQVVYKGDKRMMHDSFRALQRFTDWPSASEYLKDHFYDKDVDIYDKTVLLFVDILQDYYNQLGN